MTETPSKRIGNRGRGRPKGAINKATSEIKEVCRQHGPAMIARLVELAETAEQQSVRVSAIKEILDRGYGKATQPIGQDPELGQLGVVVIPGKSE